MQTTSRLALSALCSAMLLFPVVPSWAQSNAKPPTQMTYQGFLTDGNGTPFGNTAPVNKTVIFRIYDSLTGGTLKWSSQQVVTVDKGYFSVLLGQGSAVGSEPFNADLTDIFTGAGASDRYLELNADGTTIAPRLRFLPAPSALLAKSATELLDPSSGAKALTVSGGNISMSGTLTTANVNATGNLTASGSLNLTGNLTAGGAITASSFSGGGANLTGMNASQITSGTLSNARTTATSSGSANTIMLRDGNANVAAELVDTRTLRARSAYDSHSSGAYLEWNKDGGGGMTYLLNQKGGGGGGIVFGEVTTGNDWTERMRISANGYVGIGTGSPGASLDVNGQIRGQSFKMNGIDTLVLYSIQRFSVWTTSPMTGMSVSIPTSDGAPRQSSVPSDWWKSTSSYGATYYLASITVPAGEKWELAYHWRYHWSTDDNGGIVMSVNDTVLEDQVTSLWGVVQAPHSMDQTLILDPGTYSVRVKCIISGGSGSDRIYFPWHTPSHVVVKKYKVN